ncbi:MAG: hypothetical protein QG553_207 [Patescibacteria group bacterium]|nr:hypothetical protein [Patescibacteria group bacterium]
MSFMTKKALTVSIVIPAYNEEHHLKRCLHAIAKQTDMPDEVLVVNNNSTDATVKVARSFKFVRIIEEKNQGRAWARTAGFNAAKGQIIGRIDADTRLPTDWVERVKGFYADPAHANTALTGGCAFYNVRMPRLDQWITSQFVFRMNRLLVGHYILWGSNMAVPKKLWQSVKNDTSMRNDIHEDLDLSFILHKKGYQIHYWSTLVVGACMPHVFEHDGTLWPYLKMWPRTLQAHNKKSWPLSYVGAGFLYVMQFVPRSAERIAVWCGRPPLNERR